ncbi:MAG TPA: LysR family transcriptional regulator [Pseudonocardiaceae bacterium]|nr:LysR family transcriptional regulator [Pseudonocardiaceae bacterium]
MELRQITSFLAVVEEGQFARAAARLFLSPAAVTGHVKALERELGVRLLDRGPVELTPAGIRFITRAKALVDAANAARAAVDEPVQSLGDGLLRVGVMGHGSAELTPAVLRAFHIAQPHVELRLTDLNFTQHVSALLEHRVDVAFVRPDPKDERITSDVLTTEPRIVVVSARSEFADAGSVRLADILDLPYLSTPEGTPRAFTDYLHFTEARGGEPARRSPDLACNPGQVLTSAAAGRGVGSALYSFARYYRWPGTVCVPVADAPWQHSVLATRATDPNPLVATFRRLATGIAAAANWLAPPASWAAPVRFGAGTPGFDAKMPKC